MDCDWLLLYFFYYNFRSILNWRNLIEKFFFFIGSVCLWQMFTGSTLIGVCFEVFFISYWYVTGLSEWTQHYSKTSLRSQVARPENKAPLFPRDLESKQKTITAELSTRTNLFLKSTAFPFFSFFMCKIWPKCCRE